jgi:hypothetical protein
MLSSLSLSISLSISLHLSLSVVLYRIVVDASCTDGFIITREKLEKTLLLRRMWNQSATAATATTTPQRHS